MAHMPVMNNATLPGVLRFVGSARRQSIEVAKRESRVRRRSSTTRRPSIYPDLGDSDRFPLIAEGESDEESITDSIESHDVLAPEDREVWTESDLEEERRAAEGRYRAAQEVRYNRHREADRHLARYGYIEEMGNK